jgi:hypothetical protein
MSSQEEEKKQERKIGQNEELARTKEIICPTPHMHPDCLFASTKSFLF